MAWRGRTRWQLGHFLALMLSGAAVASSPSPSPSADSASSRKGFSAFMPELNGTTWDLSTEYNIRNWATVQTIGLCDDWALTCDMAEARTSRARATRTRARSKLAEALSEEDVAIDAIPVLGFPVAFDPDGLTLRLLASVDFPVKRLVLVLSGHDPQLSFLAREAKRMRPDLQIVRSQVNLGCAGGWNEVLHADRDAPWWLISSYDVAYPPGTLKRIARRTGEALRREKESVARGRRKVVYAPGVRTFSIHGQPDQAATFPTFAITRRAVAAAGLFDENFWPAYAEDLDYFRRLRLVGGSRVGAAFLRDPAIEVIHGPEDWKDSVHYSGIEQYLVRADASRTEYERNPWKVKATDEITIFDQLKNANNYHFHFCQKYGPLLRPGNCSDIPYADLGPFGFPSDWGDWVLDPWRRVCSTAGYWLCFYNVRVWQPWRNF